MSAIPIIEPVVEPAPIVRPRPRVPEPIIIELPKTRTRRQPAHRIRSRRRTSELVGQLAGFAAIASLVFSASSLGGQVMVEKARREGISASQRARAASREIAELRDEVQDLSSSTSVDAWALANGFMPTEAAPAARAAGENTVAQVRH